MDGTEWRVEWGGRGGTERRGTKNNPKGWMGPIKRFLGVVPRGNRAKPKLDEGSVFRINVGDSKKKLIYPIAIYMPL